MPTPLRLRRFASIALAGWLAALLLPACSGDHQAEVAKPRAVITISGTATVTVPGDAADAGFAGNTDQRARYGRGELIDECVGQPSAVEDLRKGTEVTVTNNDRTIGTSSLRAPEMVNSGPGSAGTCTFDFEVGLTKKPTGLLTITIGKKRTVSYEASELAVNNWRVSISVE